MNLQQRETALLVAAYASRMLRPRPAEPWPSWLTSLAPDIIEAVLRGDLSRQGTAKTHEPNGLPRRSGAQTGLSLEKLRKNLPVRWDEQRVICAT